MALTLFAAGIAMAFFFWRTTGSPVRMPYQVNRATYGIAPYFIWQSPNLQQVYRHAVMRDYYVNDELAVYQRMRSIGGFVRETAIKLLVIWAFYVGPVLTIPIFTLPWILHDRRIRWLLLAGAVSLAGTAACQLLHSSLYSHDHRRFRRAYCARNETPVRVASRGRASWKSSCACDGRDLCFAGRFACRDLRDARRRIAPQMGLERARVLSNLRHCRRSS